MPDEQTVEAHIEPQAAYQLHRIAGPETARLLGIPVGTLVESRDLHLVPTSASESAEA